MKLSKQKNIFGLLDIGTQKTACMIYEQAGEISNIIGFVARETVGFSHGKIVDISELQANILHIIEIAEKQAGLELEFIYVNFASYRIISNEIRVEQKIGNIPLKKTDLSELIIAAISEFQQNHEREVLHFFPLGYSIDGSDGVRDPIGMSGNKLLGRLNLISTTNSAILNLSNCIGNCHLDVENFVLNSYAAGLSSLSEEDRDLGVMLIDIGAGSTDIATFKGGAIIYADSVPFAGMEITRDIMEVLGCDFQTAERLKTLYGNADPMPADANKFVEYRLDDDSHDIENVSHLKLGKIIRSRVVDIMELVMRRVADKDLTNPQIFPKRVAITGGTAHLLGIKECVRDVFRRQIKIVRPRQSYGLQELDCPKYAVLLGLAEYAKKAQLATKKKKPKIDGVRKFLQRILQTT